VVVTGADPVKDRRVDAETERLPLGLGDRDLASQVIALAADDQGDALAVDQLLVFR